MIVCLLRQRNKCRIRLPDFLAAPGIAAGEVAAENRTGSTASRFASAFARVLESVVVSPSSAGCSSAEFLPELSFWQVSLSLFGEPECDYWPQPQVGLALWSLSTTGDQWQYSETLMRLSVLPDEAVLRNPDWVAPVLFVLRVRRPLRWFGLVECRGEDATRRGHGVWRKTPLFDRFVRFDPNLVGIGQARCTDAASATPPGSGEHASPLSMCPPGPGAKHVAQGWAGSAELWRRCASIHAMVHRA